MTPRPDPDDALTDAARRVNDPGGSHAKGYSADPDVRAAVPADGPLPLADAPPGAIHVPERDPGVQPTGRTDPDPKELIVSGGR